MKTYQQLEKTFQTIAHIQEATSILHWDLDVMMPPGGAESRANQLATLYGLAHDKMTAPQVEALLGETETKKETLTQWQQANLREMRHQWIHRNAVEKSLEEAIIKTGTLCEHHWRSARKENDFKSFAPHLEKVIHLTQQVAAAKADALGCAPYDAMLDQYDPGRTTASIDVIFNELKEALPPILEKALANQQPALPLDGPFPIEQQKKLGTFCMQQLGFDFNRGRLDVSTHPFCGGTPADVRMTTRYDEQDFTSSLMGVLHETGHALYEMGLPQEWQQQPVGQARGMAMHESQSLLVEMQICRSAEFINFITPHIQKAFNVSGKAWETENLTRTYQKVEPSFIRVDADEVTYPMHVILRYELEQALLSGDLQVNDLPAAWNEGMQRYLGITPPTDSEGCMQDIHWTDGSCGYFPTYTLGAIIAAQIFTYMHSQLPSLLANIKAGDMQPIRTWLQTHIHSKACLYPTSDSLLEGATGNNLVVKPYLAHITRRYCQT